ncbi:hypothetical protein [Oceanobacillus iheyensis HTE831]|uniref:NTP pyrophosphohydrolase MazG-like domain-containing protein n=1 Tax=Oceanobacillus iheyensis (strain DSM 14371 / CIP 107618 / JCM 11309 / KCTC 3954 / HTE831) TaxID=221109 RepID=Q8ES24_OCEIH|nr:nucleotide pyrophosphohydrolase [Oceanobacillus iheyensis]BAC12775.1 hypothetical protein [Oceanobacillus iheyensis HTE831]
MQDIHIYQSNIDEHIQKLGGYWRSISALARLQEEIGELAEIIIEENPNVNELKEEIADIYIISTCLANQYLEKLQDVYKKISIPTNTLELQKLNSDHSISNLFFQLQIQAGKIARIINHYDGDKIKKPTEKDRNLGWEVAYLHKYLFLLANHFQFNLFKSIDNVLKKSALRDKNRFSLMYDPITTLSLKRYRDFINSSIGKITEQKLWGSFEWESNKNYVNNIEKSIPSFIHFCKCVQIEGLDGYVFEIAASDNTKLEILNNLLDVLSVHNLEVERSSNLIFIQHIPFQVEMYTNDDLQYIVFRTHSQP